MIEDPFCAWKTTSQDERSTDISMIDQTLCLSWQLDGVSAESADRVSGIESRFGTVTKFGPMRFAGWKILG